ncbi:unnamed protein product [Fraxinus pennsylvanica]|uniref:Uncharacterized protein n=1 Tax=Fraxinus pennsylvanica TaxID=56036 RepID=A0AAD2A284_9LAMI|nr:unnamed protein product [Fraxinus pennsylvanica]
MGLFKPIPFFVLLLSIISFAYQESSSTRARAVPAPFLSPQQVKHSKAFSTLGMVCQCCDGEGSSIGGGECTNSWIGFAYQESSATEARAVPAPFLSPQQVKHSKAFSTLGMVCQCCDGEGSSIDRGEFDQFGRDSGSLGHTTRMKAVYL